MKLRTLALAGAAVLAMSVPAMASDTTGWYIGIGAGWAQSGDYNTTVTTPYAGPSGTTSTSYSLKPDAGFVIVGSVGYRFDDHLRVENEIGFGQNQIKGSYSGTEYFTGTVQKFTDYVNFVYDYQLGDKWTLGLGGGLGVGSLETSYKTGSNTFFDRSDLHFSVQAIAELGYALNSDTEVGVSYRYRHFSGNVNGAGSTGITVAGEAPFEHVVMVGLRLFLAPPPPVKTFIVFFDFNKSNLTQAAQAVVSEAVATAKKNSFVKIQITGHTDTVGSDKYNMKLSVARAQSVKEEMVRQGIEANGVAIEGKGFHDLLVPTGPGVREPQNRRAVIDLGS